MSLASPPVAAGAAAGAAGVGSGVATGAASATGALWLVAVACGLAAFCGSPVRCAIPAGRK